jgi:small ligand-binding sensory domain FIST
MSATLHFIFLESTVVYHVQAHGIIGNEGSMPTEVEQAPAVSLTLANMEGAEVTSFTVTGERLPDAGVPLHTNILLSRIESCPLLVSRQPQRLHAYLEQSLGDGRHSLMSGKVGGQTHMHRAETCKASW